MTTEPKIAERAAGRALRAQAKRHALTGTAPDFESTANASGPACASLRVEELAAAAAVSIDTIRFYQGRGLLAPPRREGRIALYSEEHLKQLHRIRALSHDGLPLAIIKRMLDAPQGAPIAGLDAKLLPALVKESVGKRLYSREELLREAAIPATLLDVAQNADLIQPIRVDGEARYTEADLQMLCAGRILVETGLPLGELVTLARDHAHSVEEVTERAVDLFDRHIRRAHDTQPPAASTILPGVAHRAAPAPRADTAFAQLDPIPRNATQPVPPPAAAATALQKNETQAADSALDRFHTLLPEITRLVALHFERTLIRRALQRFADAPESRDLEAQLRTLARGNTKE